ncbi:MAG TPA: glycosyltransferase [Vicinamibacterales bacterium]|jgi:glycosyltransferase involved in cell wall biosynthesis
MARVDILTPFHNTPIEWVRQAIESVQAQTFGDWKLILVDDGSSAEAAAALNDLVRTVADGRVISLRIPNGGPAAARNAAIRASDSDYLAILDSDDMWYARKLELQVPYLDHHRDVALVHANHDVLNPDGSRRPGRRTLPNFNQLTQDEIIARTIVNNIVGHGESLFRRSAAESVGLYDERLRTVEDKDLLVRMLIAGHKYVHLDETVYLYRLHLSNSTKNVVGQLEGRLQLVEKMDRQLGDTEAGARLAWPTLKRHVTQLAWRQAVEGYLDRRDYREAFRYALPAYCGWSGYTGKLVLRCAYGVLVRGSARRQSA